MRLLLALFMALAVSSRGYGADLSEPDKEKHFAASAGIAMASYGTFRLAKYGKVASSLMSFSLTMLVGHIKEATDKKYDRLDMEANAAGASAGLMVPLSFTF